MNIPFLSLSAMHDEVKVEILQATERILSKGNFILGKSVEEFERNFAAFCGAHYCVGVGNGLDALKLSLEASGVGPGDEVIVPANTFIATWLAVSQLGACPVPVEPDPETYNITAAGIGPAITAKTKAIIPVHLYGQACQMDEIMELARDHGLMVVEDNAQAQGAMSEGKRTGSFGDYSATSFYPGKNLGAIGDGGAITTNSQESDFKLRLLRSYGSTQKYVHEVKGVNSRLDEIQAAILDIKLKRLEAWNSRRGEIAGLYRMHLSGSQEVILPKIADGCTSVYHLFVVQAKARDSLARRLAESGIGTLVHYPICPHLQRAYSDLGFGVGSFPIAERLAKMVLSLPMYPGLSNDQVEFICEQIGKV